MSIVKFYVYLFAIECHFKNYNNNLNLDVSIFFVFLFLIFE
jgi:hypothetical protein